MVENCAGIRVRLNRVVDSFVRPKRKLRENGETVFLLFVNERWEIHDVTAVELQLS